MTINQLLNFTHLYTERLKIYVIIGDAWLDEPNKRLRDFWLTEDAKKDEKRLRERYGDCPVWNLTAETQRFIAQGEPRELFGAVLVVRCRYRDIREAYMMEQAEIKKKKERERRQQRKEIT